MQSMSCNICNISTQTYKHVLIPASISNDVQELMLRLVKEGRTYDINEILDTVLRQAYDNAVDQFNKRNQVLETKKPAHELKLTTKQKAKEHEGDVSTRQKAKEHLKAKHNKLLKEGHIYKLRNKSISGSEERETYWVCVKNIYKIRGEVVNICIMEPQNYLERDMNLREGHKSFTITKSDAKKYHIKWNPNLEVFSMGLNWIPVLDSPLEVLSKSMDKAAKNNLQKLF